jgi:adenylate cyclase
LEFYRNCDWEKAEKKLSECLKAKPGDGPAQTFLYRIEQLKLQPPGPEWDGVWHLDKK